MSTGQILALGAIAGLTIFLGLPIGRMQNVSAETKAFLAATATGILIFLLWDVLSEAVGPVDFVATKPRIGARRRERLRRVPAGGHAGSETRLRNRARRWGDRATIRMRKKRP